MTSKHFPYLKTLFSSRDRRFVKMNHIDLFALFV